MGHSAGHSAFSILPVILAGGIGARLAPLSTPQRPKPFLPLSPNGPSLLQHALERVGDAGLFLPPLLIGREADRFALLNHARASGVRPAAILLESSMKNTAAAVALAAAWALQQHGAQQMLAVLPADHLLGPVLSWQTQLHQLAQSCAAQGQLGLMATPARRPATGYGYILGRSPAAPIDEIREFCEKPEQPQTLMARGAHWNMGQFIGRAGDMDGALQRHAPAHRAAAHELLAHRNVLWEFTELEPWPASLPAEPFDRAVMERVGGLYALFQGDWRDLGTLPDWLAATGRTLAQHQQQPVRVDRPWGYYEEIARRADGCQKRLVLFPGCRISLQRHQHRQEEWRVVQGKAHVQREFEHIDLMEGECITIPAGAWHRLSNDGYDLLIINELQIGSPDEADIERQADDYARL